MDYDQMGRRRSCVEQNGNVVRKRHVFTYDGYLQIARSRVVDADFGAGDDAFLWDPTEPVATRPLACSLVIPQSLNSSTFFYALDGNKNVTELVREDGEIAAHYEYSAFGKTLLSLSADGHTDSLNPWRFSSEYADDATRLVYYNYRHYELVIGRWLQRDPVFEDLAEYNFCHNLVLNNDFLGLYRMISRGAVKRDTYAQDAGKILDKINYLNGIVDGKGRRCYVVELKDLELSSQEEINKVSEDAMVFVVGHGTIKDERFYGQSSFSWTGEEEPMVGFSKNDREFLPLRTLKVDARNMFGCYISPHVRKQPSGGILWWKTYTSRKDDYSVMFKSILNRLGEVSPARAECCSPTRIVIFEGEFSNVKLSQEKLHALGTENIRKRWEK